MNINATQLVHCPKSHNLENILSQGNYYEMDKFRGCSQSSSSEIKDKEEKLPNN